MSKEQYTKLYDDLEKQLVYGAARIYSSSLEGLKEYFTSMHPGQEAPRIGIFLFENSHQSVQCVHSLPYIDDASAKPTSQYSALTHVIDEGVPYLCNNLPEEIQKNVDYRHDSFNIEGIRTHYPSKRLRNRRLVQRYLVKFARLLPIIKRLTRDPLWEKNSCKASNKRGMYKSHLAIPITYRRHAEQSSLGKRLREVLEMNGDDDARAILGVILIDHPDPHYFDERVKDDCVDNLDINACYIYADMVSLALVVLRNFTGSSSTVQSYQDVVDVAV